jgi:hypothetical protein
VRWRLLPRTRVNVVPDLLGPCDIRKPDHLVICASCSETLDAWLLELPFKPIEGELGMRTASNQPDSVGSELE